jgi:hypothetical protein
MFAILMMLATLLAVDLPGKWNITYQTEGGSRERTLEITQEGDEVTAKTPEGTLKGTFKEGVFEVAGEIFSAEAGFKAVLKLSGKLEGEELKGKASWDQYQMTFTAKKAAQ